MKTLYQVPAKDGLALSVAYYPVPNSKALVQIVHGAREHKERYEGFISFLNKKGYSCVSSDNRGHGASVNSVYFLGHFGDWKLMVDDTYRVSLFAKSLEPEKPLYLFGHSFGSMLARLYLEEHDKEIAGLLLTGTVNYVPMVHLAIRVGKNLMAKDGPTASSGLLGGLGDPRDFSWINSDKAVVNRMRKDPLCYGYHYTNMGVMTIEQADAELHRAKHFKCQNPSLRILSTTGALDPCTGGLGGLEDTRLTLRNAGYKHFKSIVYPFLKHEVTNCRGNEKVLNDIALFLDAPRKKG
jgi:alpha-beta hydrolase superfamily lysophospholipase